MLLPLLVALSPLFCLPIGAQSDSLQTYVSITCDDGMLGEDFSGDSSGDSCFDLDGALRELTSGMTLILEPGTHLVEQSHHNVTRDLTDITITGSGVHETRINCTDGVGFSFIGMANLSIINLTITNCGVTGEPLRNTVDLLKKEINLWFQVPPSIKVAVLIGNCEDVTVQDVHITDTQGLGLLGINNLGKLELFRVNFTRNIRPRCIDNEPFLPSLITPNIHDQVGGGAYFLYMDYYNTSRVKDDVKLLISESYFAYNADCTYAASTNGNYPYFTEKSRGLYQYAVGAGGGLSVVLSNSNFSIAVQINKTVFQRNDARYGGGAYVSVYAGQQHHIKVLFSNCNFIENGIASLKDNDAFNETHCKGGAGMVIFTDLIKPEHFLNPIPTPGSNVVIEVIESNFIRNSASIQGGGVMAHSLFTTPHKVSDIVNKTNYFTINWSFKNCNFINNSAQYSSAGFFKQRSLLGSSGSVHLTLQKLIVSGKFDQSSTSSLRIKKGTSAMLIKSIVSTVDEGMTTFVNNSGSALHIDSSVLRVKSKASIIFRKNLAHQGGGIYLRGHTPQLILHPNCSLNFSSNRAFMQGGAIFFESPNPNTILRSLLRQDCFLATPYLFRREDPSGKYNLFNNGITLEFKDNYAPVGSIIYGSTLESCPWARNISKNRKLSLYQILHERYNDTFKFDKSLSDNNSINTPPAYINVTVISPNSEEVLNLYPGQEANIRVMVFDKYKNVIPEIITSSVEDASLLAMSMVGGSGFWYSGVKQTQLHVTGTYNGRLNVSIFTETNAISTTLLVNLSHCPLGFDFTGRSCTCNRLLRKVQGIECSNTSISFTTYNRFWIGVNPSRTNNTMNDLITQQCILNYCQLGNITVRSPNFDSQCTENRTGILCGACTEGYSVVFGTLECHKCSNYWLFLIPVFALAGAVLFISIALLEITIDKGFTITLLFFVKAVFLYDFRIPDPMYNALFLPARLLNLQIGLSTCFFDGMTALHRSVLQLAFPAYLYLLMGIFTILCRRFTWLSVRFSPPKTLMTLAVMCYLNVFIACLEILSPVPLKNLEQHVVYIQWFSDPNQGYFKGLHILTGGIGIIVILIYIIPFPILLLLPTLAYKHMKKFAPLFDALWGAYQQKFRIWLGIRLIMIALLYLTTRAPADYGFIASGIVIVSFSNIQTLIQPLKDKWANYADTFFSVMVILFYWGAEATKNYEQTPTVRIVTITYIAFFSMLSYLVMLALFIQHIYRHYRSQWTKLYKRLRMKKSEIGSVLLDDDSSSSSITHSTVYVRRKLSLTLPEEPRYRESLLETPTL